MTLKEILDKLSKTDRAVLNYSFEHGLSQYVQYEPGKYVGVNVKGKHLIPNQEAGQWSSGTLAGAKDGQV